MWLAGESYAYDSFTVSGDTWLVNELFGFFQGSLGSNTVTSVAYEVRSGMSVGNAGTLLQSGVVATSVPTSTGEFTEVVATGFDPFLLGPGTYWMGLSVGKLASRPQVILARSGGADAVNATLDNAYLHYIPGMANYNYANGSADMAYGVRGTLATVPEPSTYVLMGSGLLALGVVARRRRA